MLTYHIRSYLAGMNQKILQVGYIWQYLILKEGKLKSVQRKWLSLKEKTNIIQNIIINGIEKQELIKDLKSRISSKDKNPFVENNIENDVLLIKKLLKSSGFYFSDVTTKIVDNNNNTVDLIFDLNLGKKAYIEEIEFIGDKYYKERLLRNIIASEEKRFWKVLSKKKYINSELISLDQRLLKKFYLVNYHR